MTLLRSFPLAVALCAGAGVLGAQVTTQRLGAPTARSSEPFSQVESVVELGDGTVLVVESRERRLVLVDFSRGTARDIGRTGSGPGEFRLVSRAIARPDGGAWVVDFGLRRLLPVRRDGSFDNPIPFPVSIQLRGADASGVLYGEGFLPRTAERPDSMWILRWNPAGSRVNTLMKYNALVSASVIPAGGTFKPFAPVDAWDVLPDGDVIVIEAEQYRLNAWRDGRGVRSAARGWTPRRRSGPRHNCSSRSTWSTRLSPPLSQLDGAP
jgi:hypothetical protein